MFKKFIQGRLEKRAAVFFRKNPQLKVVAVAGSIGKTTTKHHIGTLLAEQYRVRMHEGGFNTELGAPLAVLGLGLPESLHSILGWWTILRAAAYESRHPADFDVLVLELGVDHPGDMAKFARYIHPNIAVVTAVTPEHMEYFGSLDAVAKEELSIADFSNEILINRDDIDGKYAEDVSNPNLDTYGSTGAAEYRLEISDFSLTDGYSGKIITPGDSEDVEVKVAVFGEHSLRPVMGAVAVAVKMGVTPENIAKGLEAIHPTAGRMNPLHGARESMIIDDSYNSSPAAAAAALQTLYSIDAPARIVLLGEMKELGESSAAEHEKLGDLCDPNLLAWVVTVGEQAEKYIAPAARQRGNQVKSCKTALEAGGFINGIIEPGAVILVKGSQGNIYLEEAIKIFLHDESDDKQLVRQSRQWLATKQAFFEKNS
ncbi:MAG TPA: UDP-N-acetylmuramoyl-tripeptide--D-alanyl-D-alanine ligase [Candidatus Saccharimonadaceae bacterium]|nr:UDP-N-acetylmuramoyl-tripeptide--D-alanyl-D-alanine ligase [Candidatus Saccharimonadaceae bacterium]